MKAQAPQDASSQRGKALKKWGPLGAAVVVLAVIAGVVIAGQGGDDDASASKDDSPTASTGTGALPEGVVSFSAAKEAGTVDSIDWGARCDTKSGLLALPIRPQPECFAPFKGDNGGATAPGVTADSIKVVVYVPQPDDPVLQYVYRQIGNNDTPEQTWETYLGFNEILAKYSETYGRKVDLVRYYATGTIADPVAATADAETIARDVKPFFVVGGSLLTEAFADTLAASKIACVGCTPGQTDDFYAERGPYVWSILKSAEQTQDQAAEYLGKRLAGHDAKYGGDDVNGKPRKFGYIYLSATPQAETMREQFTANMQKDYGVTFTNVASFSDPVGVATQAREMLAKMKADGVTTILYNGDPLAPVPLTKNATEQDYFPEWVITGSVLVDTTAFSRTYDQQQWAHAFGPSNLNVRVSPDVAGATYLYQWYFGTPPPAPVQATVVLPNLQLFYNVLQGAGPELTPQTLQDALFGAPIIEATPINPQLSYGNRKIWPVTDYAGIDDGVEVWWDAQATGVDELNREGAGMWRYVDNGKRYLPGEWPKSEPNLFTDADTVTIYDQLPADLQPPDYQPLK